MCLPLFLHDARGGQRRALDPGNWSYRWLWAAVCAGAGISFFVLTLWADYTVSPRVQKQFLTDFLPTLLGIYNNRTVNGIVLSCGLVTDQNIIQPLEVISRPCDSVRNHLYHVIIVRIKMTTGGGGTQL